MQETERVEKEACALKTMVGVEDLAEKKTKIYSRLLMDATLAKDMEELSLRHEKRKEALMLLLGEKPKKKKNGQGMSAMNGGEEEK